MVLCDARHKESVKKVLITLIRHVLRKTGADPEYTGTAQPAIQEGQYAARLIRARATNRPTPAPFWYWDKGDLAIVGRTYAVADLRFARFAGFPAWFLWVSVHIYFLIGFANRLFVLMQWAVAFVTKRRRGRIIDQ